MRLGVIDYGASNIHSVARALKSLGSKVSIVDTPDKFKSIDKLVFPGQGSMGSCIKKLKETEMINPLLEVIKSKPFLGICLGLQILFNSSEESQEKGLGVINGKITKIKDINNENLKIPHMGWNNVKIEKKHDLEKYEWQKPHEPNLTGTDKAYYPNKNKDAIEKKYKAWKN